MLRFWYLFRLLICSVFMHTAAIAQSAAEIDTLIAHKSFFEAQQRFKMAESQLEPIERQRLGAMLDNAFNRLAASSDAIELLRSEHWKTLSDRQRYALLEIQQSNLAKQYRYAEAASVTKALLEECSGLLDDEEKEDYLNTLKLWEGLTGAPPQELIVGSHTELQMTRDKAQLWNLDVSHNTTHVGFIFDTGANISTVTESTADRFEMRYTDASIEVDAITGIKVRSKLAVCPEFRLGAITVKNAVFLVFPDSALAIPQINYQINGIIGFPVLEALKQLEITRSGLFIVPEKPEPSEVSNMALDFLTPVILLDDEYYTFDTGATATMLYLPYYRKYKQAIEKKYKLKSLGYGGAGGSIQRNGYEIEWTPTVDGQTLSIPKTMVFSDAGRDKERDYYGNIGQDFIRQFEHMTINFDTMYIRFR